MVTVEQGTLQDQVTNSSPQTQNPQTLPQTSLQPNIGGENSLQNVIPTQNLFSNPKSNAVVTVQTNTLSAESLLASETAPSRAPNSTVVNTLLIIWVAIMIIFGSYLIIKKLLPNKAKNS